MNKRLAVCVAAAAATAVSHGPLLVAHADDFTTLNERLSDETVESSRQAFDYWSPKTLETSGSFNAPGVKSGATIDWVIPFVEDATFMSAYAEIDSSFADKLQDIANVSDLTEGVETPTPARLPDGTVVAVLPHGNVTAEANGVIKVDAVTTGAMVDNPDATDDNADEEFKRIPLGVNDASVRYLYKSGNNESGFDAVSAKAPNEAVYNARATYSLKGEGDSASLVSPQVINAIAPSGEIDFTREFKAVNNSGRNLTSTLKAWVSTGDEDLDKKDGNADGLTPFLDEAGKQVQSVKDKLDGDVAHTLSFASPDNGLVYVSNEIRDSKGDLVTSPSMDALVVAQPAIDVQASSELGSRKLKTDGETQNIYNQVMLGQLVPGQRYQVLVNLFECTKSGGCKEVAAVNREIKPASQGRVENFSANVPVLKDKDATYEWTTRVYEGTGDVKNMGRELARVADHPKDTQVLSASGQSESLKKDDDKTPTADDVVMDTHSPDLDSLIGDSEPPFDMDQVRKNNEVLDAEQNANENARRSILWGSLILLLPASYFGYRAFLSRRNQNEK